MKYNQLPHVLEHNKRQAKKHEGETLASLRVKIAALEAENAELRDAMKGLMDEAVKMAEKYLPDNAPIWAWIDDASDTITKEKGGNNG